MVPAILDDTLDELGDEWPPSTPQKKKGSPHIRNYSAHISLSQIARTRWIYGDCIQSCKRYLWSDRCEYVLLVETCLTLGEAVPYFVAQIGFWLSPVGFILLGVVTGADEYFDRYFRRLCSPHAQHTRYRCCIVWARNIAQTTFQTCVIVHGEQRDLFLHLS